MNELSDDTIVHPSNTEYKPVKVFRLIKSKSISAIIHSFIVCIIFFPVCAYFNATRTYGLILILAPTFFIIFETWLELNIKFRLIFTLPIQYLKKKRKEKKCQNQTKN